MKRKLVLFGAGKISRSLIAQLFSQGGYEIVFIDQHSTIVEEINRRKKYEIYVLDESDRIIEITNIRAVVLSDEVQVLRELTEADLLAVAVEPTGLKAVMQAIASGLVARYNNNPAQMTDIIIAENILNAAEYFKEELYSYLPVNYPLSQLVGLAETCIEKLVPLLSEAELKEDPLRVYAESFNTLIVHGAAFKNEKPGLRGIVYQDNIKAWNDRKSYIHNLGHAAIAYLGYLNNPNLKYTRDVLDIPYLFKEVRSTMMQAAMILLKMHPGIFEPGDLENYVDSLLQRFQNKNLEDTLYRVGSDLFRKLGPAERLSGAIRQGLELDMPVDKIIFVLVAGIYFRASGENGQLAGNDEFFHQRYKHQLEPILREVCGFDEEIFGSLYQRAREFDMQIQGLG